MKSTYGWGYNLIELQCPPNGQMYYAVDVYVNDYSNVAPDLKHLYIHEMGHVWQHQLGYPVKSKGLLLHPKSLWGLLYDPYKYTLDSIRKLNDYNMEQQPDIIANYVSMYVLSLNVSTNQNGYSQADYELTLSDFIRDPTKLCNL